MSENGLPCRIRIDACKPVDRPTQGGDAGPGEGLEDEADHGREEPDGFEGAGEDDDDDELAPVIRTKKRQRKSQGSGNVFWGFCSQRFGLKLFAQSALPVKRGITSFGSMRDMSGSY